MSILVTGGLGFIGSHVCVELLSTYDVVIIDNLSNSKITVLDKIKEITKKNPLFYQTDMVHIQNLDSIFKSCNINTVIHLAGLKAVGESVKNPLIYYQTNLVILLNLLQVMKDNNCKNLIFSSSATVYGDQPAPYKETYSTGVNISNPYGKTKYFAEQILQDLYKADNSYNITILRYFNPIGAHSSGLIGEDPNDKPNNLMPFILKTAMRQYDVLNIFGEDYDTDDGTCVRDYIHVVDLAKGHVAVIKKLSGVQIYNLGTGEKVSVLDIIDCFEKTNRININTQYAERRAGDLAIMYADVEKAKKELDWKTEKNLKTMCRDAWNYEIKQCEIKQSGEVSGLFRKD